jgi:hypothetical protein
VTPNHPPVAPNPERPYINPGGKKYDDDGTERDPQEWYDEEKYEISQVYRAYLDRVEADEAYTERRTEWRSRHG